MSENSNNSAWMWVGLMLIGIIFGIGPFKKMQCSQEEKVSTSYQPSFTGSSYHKYKCSVNGCLCTKYEKKSTFNSDCKNCNHHKEEHYEFK